MATIQNYLQISDQTTFPFSKIFLIDGKEYDVEIDYNSYNDFYTVKVSDTSGNVLLTNKLTYFSEINDSIIKGLDIVKKLLPLDYNQPDTEYTVNKENYSKTDLYFLDE